MSLFAMNDEFKKFYLEKKQEINNKPSDISQFSNGFNMGFKDKNFIIPVKNEEKKVHTKPR